MYMLKAVEHIHTGDAYEALNLLEKAYELKQDHTVNMLYTSTLVQTGKYEEALEIANDMPDFYKKEDKRCLLYVSILLKNHLFLQAEVIIQRKLKETYSPFYKEWKNAEKLLQYEREQEELVRRNEQKSLIKKLYALADLSLEGQLHTVEQAETLDIDTLRKVGTVIFGNPYVHTLSKSAFLQFLIKHKDTSTYQFEWFDEVRNLVPSELQLFDETTVVKETRRILEEKLTQNPSMLEIVSPEVEFHLMKLYPFIEEVVTDPVKWIDLYLKIYDESQQDDEGWAKHLDEEQREMFQWFQRLTEIPY